MKNRTIQCRSPAYEKSKASSLSNDMSDKVACTIFVDSIIFFALQKDKMR